MNEGKGKEETIEEASQPNRKKILIVDDEQMNRIVLPDLLETMGYDCLTAADGYQALEIFEIEQASIDLIILDFMMPQMNGRETFTKLREIDNQVKIIIASGFSYNEEIEAMKKEGLAGILKKPYRAADLKKMLNEVENL